MGNVERVMERVHRLLAIANDPAASDNEQHIALEQAQRLMNKHAIEEWQLEEDHDDVEIIERRIRLETNPCNISTKTRVEWASPQKGPNPQTERTIHGDNQPDPHDHHGQHRQRP